MHHVHAAITGFLEQRSIPIIVLQTIDDNIRSHQLNISFFILIMAPM